MIKYEIEYPIYPRTCEVAKKEDYEKNLCDLDYGETLSTTYKNALKKAVKFLKKYPHTFVGIHDYDDYYDTCRESCDDMVEVIDGVVYKNGHKLKQEWQDLFKGVAK